MDEVTTLRTTHLAVSAEVNTTGTGSLILPSFSATIYMRQGSYFWIRLIGSNGSTIIQYGGSSNTFSRLANFHFLLRSYELNLGLVESLFSSIYTILETFFNVF